MFKTQINADVPINEGSGQIVTELPFVPHKGDFIMVGDEQTQWKLSAAPLSCMISSILKKILSISS